MTELLHLHSGNLFGGIESSLITLARYGSPEVPLRSHFGLCFAGRLSRELRAANADVQEIGTVRISRPWTILRARRRVDRLLRESRFDAVACHSSWSYSLFAPVVRAHRLPLIFWAHDIPEGRHWLERWAARTLPDLVLANSGVTRDAVPALFPDVPCEVLYQPVPRPRTSDSAREQVRRAFDTPNDAIVILISSRLERWKGHSLLLRALGDLHGVDGWIAWIVGGPQRPHERRYLAELIGEAQRSGIAGRVRFIGQRDDVAQVLAAADIHCQPNTGPEPFGVAFIEALYAGLPVVTTAIGAAREIVDERCGVLVPAHDPATLAAVLARLIGDGDERRRLGRSAPTRAAELCDPIQQIGRLREIVQGVSERA